MSLVAERSGILTAVLREANTVRYEEMFRRPRTRLRYATLRRGRLVAPPMCYFAESEGGCYSTFSGIMEGPSVDAENNSTRANCLSTD